MNKILIIEDDQAIAEIERDYFEMNNFDVTIVPNGLDGISKATQNHYDIILLDLMLPGIDGFSVCKELRKSLDIPILMVTARHEDIDKIRGLSIGADDYIEKPFSPSVLVAKVKANLNQYKRLKGTSRTNEIKIGNICIYPDTRQVFSYGKECELKNKEYELLLFLMKNVNIVFDKETLYERVWGMNALGDNATVAVHINRIREKLEKDPSAPIYIQTVWGAGYRFKEYNV